MAELSSYPTQNSGPTGTVDSREAAMHIGAFVTPHTSLLKAKSGFRPGAGSSPGVVTATGTPDGFVHVAPFQLFLQNIRGSGFGCYVAACDAIKDINILSTPADPTNPRNDLIIAQQSDIFDSDANSNFDVKQVVGTPAASPADPTPSGSTNYVTLARVRVDATATTIVSGKITDLRTSGHSKSLTGGLYAVGLGGILPVASQAERDALTGIYSGMGVWRTDAKYLELYDGAAWAPQMAKIAETILGGTSANIQFASIPQTFRQLRLVIVSRGDAAAVTFVGQNMRFNADTGTNYDYQQIVGNGTTALVSEAQSTNSGYLGEASAATAPAGAASIAVVDIPHYRGTTFWKYATTKLQLTTGTGAAGMQSKNIETRWRNTGAITQIDIFPTSGNFIAGSSFCLYGLP